MKQEITIPVRKIDFNNNDEKEIVAYVVDYANHVLQNPELYNEGTESDETLATLFRIYFVDYYLCEVNNGGFAQYVYNSSINQEQIDYIYYGLEAMGAIKHAELYNKGIALLNTLSQEEINAFFSSGFFGKNETRDKLNSITDEFFILQEEENILSLNAKWILQQKKLLILNEA